MSQQVRVYKTLELKEMAGSCARFLIGTSSDYASYTAGTPPIAWYFTNNSTTSTNAEPMYVYSEMTGVGGYGGRCRFHTYSNVATYTNFMALKAYTEFGSAGRITGLATAFCAELKVANAVLGTGGGYFPLEIEYVAGGTTTATSPTGCQAGFIYMGNSGDADGDFDDNGVLFQIDGLTAGSGHLYDTTASTATGDATLKIRIGTATKYILIADDAS